MRMNLIFLPTFDRTHLLYPILNLLNPASGVGVRGPDPDSAGEGACGGHAAQCSAMLGTCSARAGGFSLPKAAFPIATPEAAKSDPDSPFADVELTGSARGRV